MIELDPNKIKELFPNIEEFEKTKQNIIDTTNGVSDKVTNLEQDFKEVLEFLATPEFKEIIKILDTENEFDFEEVQKLEETMKDLMSLQQELSKLTGDNLNGT